MPFQFTFRADDITTWDVSTRDLVENRDRELELYSTTIDAAFTTLNADYLTSGTVPSARMTGAYTGITSVGTLGSLTVTGDVTVDTNTLRVDSTNNRVGINVTSPTVELDMTGTQVIRAAATQDGIQLAGRVGGTTGLTVKLIPEALSGNRTLTLPNVNGTVITTGNLSSITSVGTLASGSIPATLLTGTISDARLTGAYAGITGLGTLTSLTLNGPNAFSPVVTISDWNQNGEFTAIRSAYGYLLFGSANGPNANLYLRTETASGTVIIGGGGSGSTANNTMTVGASSVSVTGSISATTTITATGEMTASKLNVGGSYFNTTPQVSGHGIAFTGATVGGGTANLMGMRWANPNITGTVDNAVTAVLGTVSDRRFKTNINTLSNVLPTVRQLRPVTYNPLDVIGFNEDNTVIIGDKDPYDEVEGFIADEVEAVAPWLVQGGENGGYQSVNYALFTPMLVAAIQELDIRLQQLETT